MADIDDIINNPNFGALYSQSSGVRSFFKDFLRELPYYGDVSDAIKVTTRDGKIHFRIQDDSRNTPITDGESVTDYYKRVAARKREGYSRYRRYDGSAQATRTGGFFNSRMNLISQMTGARFDLGSFNMGDSGAADQIMNLLGFGDTGLIIGREGTSTTVQMFGQTGVQNTADTLRAMGIAPGVDLNMKRYNAFFNEASLEIARRATDGLTQVAAINQDALLGANPALQSQVDELIAQTNYNRRLNKKPSLTVDEVTTLKNRVADGAVLMSRSSYNRHIAFRRQELGNLKRELKAKVNQKKYARGSPERAALQKSIDDLEAKLRQLGRQPDGTSGIMRAFNLFDVESDQRYEFIKGEAIVVDDKTFYETYSRGSRKPVKMAYRDLISSVDYLTTSDNLETTTGVSRKFGIDMSTREGQITFSTFETLPGPKQTLSNTLTTATYGQLIDSQGYLTHGLRGAIDKDMTAIRNGEIPPALLRAAEVDKHVVPKDLTPDQKEQARKAREFINRFKAIKRAGGDPSRDPHIIAQLTKHVREHYFQDMTKGPPKIGEDATRLFDIDGNTYRALSARFPMEGSTTAHLESPVLASYKGRKTMAPGVIGIDSRTQEDGRVGRFVLSAADTIGSHKAFGGFDFDDSVYNIYQYDPKTKRILVKMLRDPNAMGEYMIFDADITHDKNIPEHIRRVYLNHNRKIEALKRAHQNNLPQERVESLIAEINSAKKEIDLYFRGKHGDYKQDFIRQVDIGNELDKNMVAPTGYRRNSMYSTGSSSTLSMHQLSGNAADIASRVATDSERMKKGTNVFSVFEYVGDDYDEYGKYFKQINPTVSGAKSVQKINYDEYVKRLNQVQQDGGLLGKAINQYTVIDMFLQTHLDMGGYNGVDPRITNRLKELLQRGDLQLSRVDRETLIDAVVKEGDPKLLREIKASLGPNAFRLGSIIRELQDYADYEGIDFRAGLDPVVYQERFVAGNFDNEYIQDIVRGYGSHDFLLSGDDSKSYMSRMQMSMHEELQSFIELAEKERQAARLYRSQQIGTDYTPQQLSRAQDIIDRVVELGKAADSITTDDAARMIREGNIIGLDRLSAEGRSIAMLAELEGMDAQSIRAIERVLIDSGTDSSLLSNALDVPGFNRNVADVFSAAREEQQVLKAISEIPSIISQDMNLDQLKNYVKRNKDGSYSFGRHMPATINTRLRNAMLADSIFQITDNQELYERFLDDFFEGSGDQFVPDEFDQLRRFAESIQDRGVTEFNASPQIGQRAAAYKEHAAQESEKLNSSTQKRMKQLTKSQLMGRGDEAISRYIRRGWVGLAAFAGVGLVHRMTAGERDVKEFNPYPMISKESYPDFDPNDYEYASNRTVGGGMNYRIVASGMDPAATGNLSSELNAIIGGGSTISYNALPRSPYQNRGNSQARLEQRLS